MSIRRNAAIMTLFVALTGVAATAPVAATSATLSRADQDCSDFTTWTSARAFYDSQPSPYNDPHGLDSDGDNYPCEYLAAEQEVNGEPGSDNEAALYRTTYWLTSPRTYVANGKKYYYVSANREPVMHQALYEALVGAFGAQVHTQGNLSSSQGNFKTVVHDALGRIHSLDSIDDQSTAQCYRYWITKAVETQGKEGDISEEVTRAFKYAGKAFKTTGPTGKFIATYFKIGKDLTKQAAKVAAEKAMLEQLLNISTESACSTDG